VESPARQATGGAAPPRRLREVADTSASREIVLRFEPEALERCYATAGIVDECFGHPPFEYALLGLAPATDPLRVVATPLLPRQRVTPSSVEQPGRGVFAMRREIEALSERQGRQLVPICFIHRHPGSCNPSLIDLDFLTGPLLRQLSTRVRFDGLAPDDPYCDSCWAPAAGGAAPDESPGSAARLGRHEHALCQASLREEIAAKIEFTSQPFSTGAIP
jgi:hypothetical protein